jgi:hypothetical protein
MNFFCKTAGKRLINKLLRMPGCRKPRDGGTQKKFGNMKPVQYHCYPFQKNKNGLIHKMHSMLTRSSFLYIRNSSTSIH